MTSAHRLTDLLAVVEQAANQLEPLHADLALRELWQERITSGTTVLLAGDFPEHDAAHLLIAAVASQTKKPLDFTAAQRLVSAYLANQPDTAFWPAYAIKPEQGTLYVHMASQGALTRVAKCITEAVSLADWEQTSCPICGSEPKFAVLESEVGARKLVCGTCFTAWPYKRIGCASCGEEQPDRLKVLTADEFPAWSVSACLTCRSFIKTVDLRQLASSPIWQEATLSTLPLDYAAIKWLKQASPVQNQ